MAERSLLKNAFFYVCVEFPCFFYASVEKFHASIHMKLINLSSFHVHDYVETYRSLARLLRYFPADAVLA